MKNEIGRELRVSELKPKTIVVLERPDVAAVTMWVMAVGPERVAFWAGANSMGFIARRVGPELEQITDDSGRMLRVYEYLGEP